MHFIIARKTRVILLLKHKPVVNLLTTLPSIINLVVILLINTVEKKLRKWVFIGLFKTKLNKGFIKSTDLLTII